ncbi:hypothetical protein THARTR1_10139 [Trichoderma harzianum]|uniref:Required for respiratory growth protein 9, mitochondrial n=1 Tax=Trichoderma harzianum TaxID=5544 RepID=A0A2K0TU52_TRIHA|nr:hypothetical protein THARTR1_10139 [Trichoderma harzianum]
MSCSCRAVPWRTFARGLAQIHRPDASPAVQFRWLARPLVLGQNRGLHASGLRRQDGAATAVDTKKSEEDAQPSMAKAVDEMASSVDAEADSQPAERKRTRRDGGGKRRFAAADGGEGSKKSTSRAKMERKVRPNSAETEPADSTGQSSQSRPRTQEPWQVQKAALKEKFPEGWQPRKRLSPDALAGIRALNAQFPDVYTTDALADKFQVSREAIRRILKSNWRPSVDEEEDRQQRWFKRGKQVWEQKAALGIKPPQRWRMEGIARDPAYHEWSKKASQREKEWEEEEIRKYRAYREKMKKKAEGKTKL